MLCSQAFSQNGGANDGSRQFILPVFPNQINTLAGTMGELRFSHFHTGIDIRTRGQIGLPIVAAADGFINRISVQGGGYGNALYLQHPDGKITVYAHLDRFTDEIADFVRKEQYKRQRFEMNLFPARGQFQFKQGELIAYSGNSGSSSGPHLHFDLRDENQNLLNPLEYGLHEVVDEIPPVARRIALTTLTSASRVYGEFGRFEFSLFKNGSDYITRDTLKALGTIGLELYSYDRQNYTFFRTGIPSIKVLADNQEIYRQQITEFSFSDQSDIDVFTNYQKKISTGRSFTKLYIDDGNDLQFLDARNKGRLSIAEGEIKNISIEMMDAYGNKSSTHIVIKGENSPESIRRTNSRVANVSAEIMENLLVIKVNRDSLLNNNIKLYKDGVETNVEPDYSTENNVSVFLIDLRRVLPDSISTGISKKYFNFKAMVPPGISYSYYGRSLDIDFNRNSLFDTLYLATSYDKSPEGFEVFEIGEPSLPLKGSIKVTLKPGETYSNKTAVYKMDSRGNLGYVGGTWDGNKISFRTSGFGNFTLATDSIPPAIRPILINRDNFRFIIEDKMSGIKEYKAYLDNQWILMNYDPKRKLIWSDKLDPSSEFSGEFVLRVTDNAGNEKEFKTKL